jgi:hypothetical protein
MKQTATEYLFEKLWETPKDKLTWNAILEQAKEMDKNNIIDGYVQGLFDGNNFFTPDFDTAEQYYKETYDK